MVRPRKHAPAAVGDRFGRLVVQRIDGRYLLCFCDCGRPKRVREDHARGGRTKSCGCLRIEVGRRLGIERALEAGPAVGTRFGCLVVESVAGDGVRCLCECGGRSRVRRDHLLSGATTSCGCGRLSQRGLSVMREYRCWRGMLRRCENEDDKCYGGRGISVCERWRGSFVLFLEDIGLAPSPDMTIERVDNDGNYEPGNVRWATRRDQARNRRTNRLVRALGKEQSLQAWADEQRIKRETIARRLRAGWNPDKAVLFPVGKGSAA